MLWLHVIRAARLPFPNPCKLQLGSDIVTVTHSNCVTVTCFCSGTASHHFVGLEPRPCMSQRSALRASYRPTDYTSTLPHQEVTRQWMNTQQPLCMFSWRQYVTRWSLQRCYTRCHRRRSPTDCKGRWTLPPELSVTLENLIVDWRQYYSTSYIHLLDVPERIEYKHGVTVYRCLHGRAVGTSVPCWPPHPSLWCCSSPSSSANLNRLTVPRCRLSTCGGRAFYYDGLTVWNSLLDEPRNCDSFDRFKRFIKQFCSVATVVWPVHYRFFF